MSSLIKQIEVIYSDFESKINTCSNINDVVTLKSEFLGKKGKLSSIMKSLKDATVEERKIIGQKSNEYKELIVDALNNKTASIEKMEMDKKLESKWVDITALDSLTEKGVLPGGYHPVEIIQRELEDIFISMGFDVLDGPHIEDEYHNFEALNIAADHPARDMQDTFWFSNGKNLLRTHTSTIQVRGMKEKIPPFKFIAPGKVFRCERTDASHEMVFHQMEGMMVAEDISVANLIYFMKELLGQIFKKDVEVRLRPGFFPFVEPGFELDIKCLICAGKGCSVCKQVGWVELLPCGMVHPNVLRHGDIDPEKYSGFAFGLGLDRLVMMRYGIDDIRHLHSGDLRFSSQFKTF